VSIGRLALVFAAVDAILMAGFYALVMARLRSLPPSIPWTMETVWGLLKTFLIVLVLMNAAWLMWVWGFRQRETVPRVLAVIAGTIVFLGGGGFFFFQILLGLFAQY
jgi:hypothetical protein